MTKQFPTYNSHNDVACFNCTHNLTTSESHNSGFAPKHGAHKKECPSCGMKTWYDITPPKSR